MFIQALYQEEHLDHLMIQKELSCFSLAKFT
jgi:hypothetical protein